MYLFGRNENTTAENFDVGARELLLKEASIKQAQFAKISLFQILTTLDEFGKKWQKGAPLYEAALRGLKKEISFSDAVLEETLAIIPSLLSKETLSQRVRAELGSLDILDTFTSTPSFEGKVMAFPLGKILHVSSGNVFLGCIDSLLMGFLTKNISIIKLSSKNQFFPKFFAQSLRAHDVESILADKFSLLSWKGGESEIESFFKKSVNGIIAWGGEEMLAHYQKDLPITTKLFDYGPKISMQILSRASFEQSALPELAQKIVRDIVIWDQNACASPQNLFVEEGVSISTLMAALSQSFQESPLPRGRLSDDEAVEILKEKERARYHSLMEGGAFVEGKDFLIHFDPHPYLRPSPLNRTLIIKKFKNKNDLVQQLENFSFYLQSCSYSLISEEKQGYLTALAGVGMKRFAPVGTIMNGMTGAPHDGRYGLRDLVSFIPDEVSAVVDFKNKTVSSQQGYYFASGGTTGNPKFTFYSNDEFEIASEMIAYNLKLQGVKPGMVCANLFAPGQMWSSFLAVDKALEKLGMVQLPIGGNASPEFVLDCIQRFKAEILLGIPSVLLQTAEVAETQGLASPLKMVFYAGEHLNTSAREYLNRVWNVNHIGSCGYASVDAGVIGYQCLSAKAGEHHLFSQYLSLEIENGEGLVTAHYRKSDPVIRHPVGDLIEMVSEPCACRSSDPKFRILGRVDSRMNVFGCRLLLEEVEIAIAKANFNFHTYQIQIDLSESENAPARDIVTLAVEQKPLSESQILTLTQSIYNSSLDVKKSITFEEFLPHFKVKFCKPASLNRNLRTGKIKPILDSRYRAPV